MNPSLLREARGQIAVQFADRAIDRIWPMVSHWKACKEGILAGTIGTGIFCSLWVFA